jgi:hypothetical protein
MPPRPEVVNELVEAALDGMSYAVDGASGDEVMSACFTLTRSAMRVAMERSPRAAVEIQKILGMLIMECVSSTPNPKDVQ